MINYIGIGIILFFLLFVFLKREKRSSDYLLAAINLLIAGILALDLWVRHDLNPLNFTLQTLSSYFILPTFLSYGLLLIEDRPAIRRNFPWYASFAVLATGFILIDFTLLHDYGPAALRQLYEDPPLAYHLMYKAHNVFVLFALLWFRRRYQRYKERIRAEFSFIEPIRLAWLQHFSIVYWWTNLLTLVLFLSYNFGLLQHIEIPFTILSSVLVTAIFYLSFNGIRQMAAAELQASQAGPAEDSPESPPEAESSKKYQSSSLGAAESEALYERIKSLFEEDKIYLEAQLQVQDLADRLEVSNYKISQTLNEVAGAPFYDIVNGYRVAHFQRLLHDPAQSQFTILALGLESGFNSKASMNRIFKQHTGQSPSEFKKAQTS